MENLSYLKAEISAAAVHHNLQLLKGLLKDGTRFCAAVKADCYGHGLSTLLGVIGRHADCLAVATPEEAIGLRRLGYERPVLVFFSACAYADGPELQNILQELVVRNIILTVVAPQEVRWVSQAAQRVGVIARVHVKLDTGMGRSGICPRDAAELAECIRSAPGVQLAGLYSHFATADDESKTFANRQLSQFMESVAAVGGRGGLTLHIANSAATIDLPASHLDMVRPGIAIYGYQPSDHMVRKLPLKPILRLTGRLMQVRSAPAGSFCGYGLTCRLERDSRLGLAPVGYGDGYFRSLSNLATMRIRGVDVPIRGRVSMDQVILDLTDAPAAQVGDEVEIISNDPAAPHCVESLARLARTIPYEITCRLGRRVRRVLVDDFPLLEGIYEPVADAKALQKNDLQPPSHR